MERGHHGTELGLVSSAAHDAPYSRVVHYSGDVGLPPAAHLPVHTTKTFVEHRDCFVHSELLQMQEQQNKATRDFYASAATHGGGGGSNSVGFAGDHDAQEYEPFVANVVDYLRKLADLFGGFAAGFSAFMVLAVYVDREASSSEFFLMVYSTYYHGIQKIFMLVSVFLIVLMLAPMAFELAMRSPSKAFTIGKRPDDTVYSAPTIHDVLRSSSSSPFRYLVNVRFMLYVGGMLATFVTNSVEQNRNEEQIRALSSSEVSRLHVAIIIRGAMHVLAWLLQLLSANAPMLATLAAQRTAVVSLPRGSGPSGNAAQQGTRFVRPNAASSSK